MTSSFPDRIVLIHGYGFDRRIWYPVEIAFDGFRVTSLSLPGFGDDALTGEYTIERLADYYWTLLKPLPGQQIHLVGHSMGGYVCMEMVSRFPQYVSSISLLHSHVFEDSLSKKESRSAVLHEIKNGGRLPFVERMISSLLGKPIPELNTLLTDRGNRYSDEAWYYGTQAIRDRKDHSETLRMLKIPVLMLMGEKDNAVSLEMVYRQASMAERCELVVYPGVGHVGMYENTAVMISDLRRFFIPFLS